MSKPLAVAQNYLVDESILGRLYTTIFPLDLVLGGRTGHVFELKKRYELFPIMVFLIPFVVLMTGVYWPLSFLGTLMLFAIEAALLAGMSAGYMRLSAPQAIQLAMNYFCALCVWSLILLVVSWFVGCAANPDNWPEDD